MMPSLLKYFTIVGGVLLSLLIAANAVLEPGGPGPTFLKAEAAKPAVRHDPRASKVERLRAEEAAAEKARTASLVESPVAVTEPAMPRPVEAAIETPAQISAAASLVSSAPTEDEAARATQLAQEKIKAEKAKARKKQIARERAKAKVLEEASAQQAQPAYSYAPRQAFGPFGQGGGWGRW